MPPSLRTLLKSPRYTLLAVGIIALGTGACAAVFSLFDSLMLSPRAGLAQESRLVDVGRTQDGAGFDNFSYPDFSDYRTQNSTFVDLAAIDFSPNPAGLTAGSEAQSANLQWVSANLFSVLGTRFAAGRSFIADDKTHPEVVLSHRYWQRRFASAPDVVGRSVLLNGTPVTIVGVAEPGFTGPTVLAADVWAPLPLLEILDPGNTTLKSRTASFIVAIGRLKPGVTVAQAQLDLGLIAGRIAAAFPDSHRGRGVAVQPSSRLPGEMRQMADVFLGILGLLSLLTLLVASANIAGLMLARGAARQREFAVRSALGADRARLIRTLLAEHVALFAASGAIGSLVCLWLVDSFRALVPALPVDLDLNLRTNPAVFAFVLALSLLVGVVFSLGPALGSSRFDLLTVLRRSEQPAGGARVFSLRGLFLVIQLTLSLALLTTAGMLTRSLWQLAHRDPGFDSRRVEFVQFDLATAGLNDRSGPVFLGQLLAATRNLPAVARAAFTVAIPLDGNGFGFGGLFLPGAAKDAPGIRTDWNLVSPDYFATLGIPLLQGRDFTAADAPGKPRVGIVNETLARQLWPGRSALGETLLNDEGQPVQIIAVARDAKYRSAGEAPRAHFYAPLSQNYFRRPSLIVKTRDDATVVPVLRELVHRLQPNLPIYHAQNLAAATAAGLMPQRIAAGAALGTGLLALILAATGVYGVTFYWTTLRTREFGVRTALGATPRNLLVLALSGSLRLALVATLFGLAAAFALGQVVNSLFGGVTPDPLVFAATALIFTALITLAAWLPASRATKVDPTTALRAE
jgi:predicted permease